MFIFCGTAYVDHCKKYNLQYLVTFQGLQDGFWILDFTIHNYIFNWYNINIPNYLKG